MLVCEKLVSCACYDKTQVRVFICNRFRLDKTIEVK